jgi:aminobenzoyl-glutamate transport protein
MNTSTMQTTFLQRFLGGVERAGNKLPDPAVLFLWLLGIVFIGSWALSGIDWGLIDPRDQKPLAVRNLLDPANFTAFVSGLVTNFTSFPPLGVVLVSLLGIGVAEQAGFISAGLCALLSVTAKQLLTPMLIIVAILSHAASDSGYVLVIPLGGVLFYAMGRHPLAGIAAAFAGVSGGFSATFLPTSLEPMLTGITSSAAHIIDPKLALNTLNNFYFTAASGLFLVATGWYLTDKIVEPRLLATAPLDGDLKDMPKLEALSATEKSALFKAMLAMVIGLTSVIVFANFSDSAWRNSAGSLTANDAPLMRSIVPMIFCFFLLPGVVYGYITGAFKSHRDVIAAMSKSMGTMAYYIVLAFFIAQFIAAFNQSNIGVLLALEGAAALKAAGLHAKITIVGLIFLTALINLMIGSASAKWALLAPVFVPMFMQLGISPDLTQAAYRVGDSTTNIITPLMPYFPLVVVFCQKYVKGSGVGTLLALMLPYSVCFLIGWSIFLLVYWWLGFPLGLGASYVYPALS